MSGKLFKNAFIVDGTGAEPFMGEVLVEYGRITYVGARGTARAAGAVEIDLDGLCLSPGFIDVHSHGDNAPLCADPDLIKVLQGVTTEVVGNCGASLAPRDDRGSVDQLIRRTFRTTALDWLTTQGLFAQLDRGRYVTNMAPMVGLGMVRGLVCGMRDAPASHRQVAEMARLVAEACVSGCIGASTGLVYAPGLYAGEQELSRVLAPMPEGSIYATHMRDEGSRVFESVSEAIRIAQGAGCNLQISHLKIASRTNWGRAADLLGVIAAARAAGLIAHQDVYPYTAASMSMDVCLPVWAVEGGSEGVVERLRNPSVRHRIRKEIEAGGSCDGWESFVTTAGFDGITIGSTASGRRQGETLLDLGRAMEQDPFEAMFDLMVEERNDVKMIAHVMDERDLMTFMTDPFTMIGSDGAAPGTGGFPHPRAAGTFPRFLGRYVRERQVMTLPEGVRRMTSLPAAAFGLGGRGRIREGFAADLVAFDPETVDDRSTYSDPMERPEGIRWVLVNGKVVVRDSVSTGVAAGGRLFTPRTFRATT